MSNDEAAVVDGFGRGPQVCRYHPNEIAARDNARANAAAVAQSKTSLGKRRRGMEQRDGVAGFSGMGSISESQW